MNVEIPATVPTSVGTPRIGEPAPDFEAETTHGLLRLEDYKGSWLVLFSHPASFTPVCTEEFVAFAKAHPSLRQLGCELMGLSTDSVASHIAWVRDLEKTFDIEIDFPVIADLDQEVAGRYGMILPGESKTETSRGVFIIDGQQTIRAIIYYPLATGRSVDEIVQVIKALQATDQLGLASLVAGRANERASAPYAGAGCASG